MYYIRPAVSWWANLQFVAASLQYRLPIGHGAAHNGQPGQQLQIEYSLLWA